MKINNNNKKKNDIKDKEKKSDNNKKKKKNNNNIENKVDSQQNNNKPEQKGFDSKLLQTDLIDDMYKLEINYTKDGKYDSIKGKLELNKKNKKPQKEIDKKKEELLEKNRLIHFKGNKEFDKKHLEVSGYKNNYVELKEEKQFREKNKNIKLEGIKYKKEGDVERYVYYTQDEKSDESKAPRFEIKGSDFNNLVENYDLYKSLLPLLEEAMKGESALKSINIMYKIYKEVVEFNDKFKQNQDFLNKNNNNDNKKDIEKDDKKNEKEDQDKSEELKKEIEEAKYFIEQNKQFYNKINAKDSQLLTKNLIKKMQKLYERKIYDDDRKRLDKGIKKIVEQKKALKKNNGVVIPPLGIKQEMNEEQLLYEIEELQGQLDGLNNNGKKGYAFGKENNNEKYLNAKLVRNKKEIEQCEKMLKKDSDLILSYKERIKVLEGQKDKTHEAQKKIKSLEETIQNIGEQMLNIKFKKESLEEQVKKDTEEKGNAEQKFNEDKQKKQEAVKKELDEKLAALGGEEGLFIAKLNMLCKASNLTFYKKAKLEEVIKEMLKNKKPEEREKEAEEIRKEYFDNVKKYCEKNKGKLIPLFANENEYNKFVENYLKPEVKQEQNNKKDQLPQKINNKLEEQPKINNKLEEQPKINNDKFNKKNKNNNKRNINNYKKKEIPNNKNVNDNLKKKNKFKDNQNNIN